jgi:homospermidine synthase
MELWNMTDDPKGDAPKATAAKPATRRKPAAAKTTTGSASGSRTSRTKASASKTTAAAKPAAASAARKPAASKAASKPAATKTAATRASAAKGPAAKSATAKPATAKPAAASKTIAPATASAAKPATAKPAASKAATGKPRAAKTAASKPAAQKTAAAKTATAAKASAAKTTPAKTPAKKPVTRKAPAKSAASKSWPVHGTITGPLVMIGLGSIGKGALPLIERHFKFDKSRFTVIDPVDTDAKLVTDKGYKFQKVALTPENYGEVLTPLLSEGEGQGFVVNLSVDTSSLDLMKFCRNLGVLYIDTVVEPWPGFYFDDTAKAADRTNYMLRETVRKEKKKNPGGTTAVSCCGANPGMVSWFVKQALVDIATDTGVKFDEPSSQKDWAKLMKKVGVKGIHIAERDTQRAKEPKPMDEFWNTWSVEGFLSEGFQPAELGWGTHETWKPKNAKEHKKGCRAAIYLEQPGASTRVRTWCPTPGPQHGFLVTHNEAISPR